MIVVFIVINAKDNSRLSEVKNESIENNKVKNENNILNGTFIYNEDINYVFNGINKGSMNHKEEKFIFTYVVNENELKIDFEDELVHDATYTFELNDSQLRLIGGEGTTGGEYILYMEKD